jgi:hypothetical protein
MSRLRECPRNENKPIKIRKETRSESICRKEEETMNKPSQRKAYPSDLTEAQWKLIAPFIPVLHPRPSSRGRSQRAGQWHPVCSANRLLVEANAS